MQVANQSKRKRRRRNNNNRGLRRTDNDPLQSFDGDNVNLDSVIDEDGGGGGVIDPANDDTEGSTFDDPLAEDGEGGNTSTSDMGFVANKSTAGRKKWQEKHKRGKYSKKYQKKEKGLLGF